MRPLFSDAPVLQPAPTLQAPSGISPLAAALSRQGGGQMRLPNPMGDATANLAPLMNSLGAQPAQPSVDALTGDPAQHQGSGVATMQPAPLPSWLEQAQQWAAGLGGQSRGGAAPMQGALPGMPGQTTPGAGMWPSGWMSGSGGATPYAK